ncbi:MAG: ATP-binding protein [Patescibacteria group bacterium]|nr:ATP-binding protein [Patescibacteria group bacterium]
MKKFYNRKNELALLNKHFNYAKNNLITEVMMGRRRIGKTEIVRKYIKKAESKSLYFYVTKKSSQIILDDFTAVLKENFDFLPNKIVSWEDFFNIIFALSKKTRIIVVFDEFQNFQYIEKSVFSILQKKIDEYKNTAKMHLLLIGSIQTLMEKIFKQKEPLYGRVDNFIYLKPFEFSEIVSISHDHGVSDLEKIFDFYAIFNGVAKYYDLLEKFNLFDVKLEKMLEELVIRKDTPLYKEGENLLIEEFGNDYERYFDILFCLSCGKTKINEVVNIMQLPTTTISKYLSVLINKYKLVERKTPLEKKNSRDSRYCLKDIFLKFWFRYVYKNYNKIEIEAIKPVIADFKKTFRQHKGLIFEELVREILFKKIVNNNILPFCPQSIGSYWDKKREIDIYGEDKKNVLIGEIKLSAKAIDAQLINKLEEFAKQQKKQVFKVVVSFDKIKDKRTVKLLNELGYYVFEINRIINF